MSNIVKLIPVTVNDIEWLRVERNKPEQYKYFKQDRPITEEQQKKWWKNLDKNRVKLFLADVDGKRVGYAGFNPYNLYACSAELGLFIIKEHQDKGYGLAALLELLKYGFENCNLSTIYSDVLSYPGEDRFSFYQSIGFMAYPDYCQTITYKKGDRRIPSIKFYMTKDMWTKIGSTGGIGDNNVANGMGGRGKEVAYSKDNQGTQRKGVRVYTSAANF